MAQDSFGNHNCQSYLISVFCTQFQLFALNFNFLHCLGLIYMLLPNVLHVYYLLLKSPEKKTNKQTSKQKNNR